MKLSPNFILCASFLIFTTLIHAQTGVKYIHTGFENASPLDWHTDSTTGTTHISLVYDHERSSPNRANGHWHFAVEAATGTEVTLILKNFDNIWNGMSANPVTEKTSCLISEDGKHWAPIPTEFLKDNRLKIVLKMPKEKVYLASVEPYRISDLEKLKKEIGGNALVSVTDIGKTVEGRPLEIIRVGDENAPHHVFLRARAHSWEPGGNWVVQGLIRSLLRADASKYLKKYCIYVMPMANKDGVARGRTRFNMNGVDLNRQWDKPADSLLAPEKHAFESWLVKMIATGKKPDLAIDLHNDNFGNVHVNLPTSENKKYSANMKRFTDLLYKHTWFTEGPSHVKNPGSFGEAMARRFGIDACIYEFNYEWAKGLNKVPLGSDWELLGSQLRDVFLEYFP